VGLVGQIARRCRDRGLGFAAPSPFCTLTSRQDGDASINEFADRFGLPELCCRVSGSRIVSTRVVREAPCGNTRFVAERLVGVSVENAVSQAGLLHHYYPCLAGMDQPPVNSHTLLHRAAKITSAAVSRALSDPTGSDPTPASVFEEENEHVFARLSGDVER
jgi:thymidylate synthase